MQCDIFCGFRYHDIIFCLYFNNKETNHGICAARFEI